jgi:hypothetical protein
MTKVKSSLDVATVAEHCRQLRLPTVASQFERLAQEAIKTDQSHVRYLAELLGAELDERERHTIERRIKDSRLPRLKTLDEFDFTATPKVPAKLLRELSEGGYMKVAEPVIFIGDSGTGKTHLATGLCIAACQQKKRCRFVLEVPLPQSALLTENLLRTLTQSHCSLCQKNPPPRSGFNFISFRTRRGSRGSHRWWVKSSD